MTEDAWRTIVTRPLKLYDHVERRLVRRQLYAIGIAAIRLRWREHGLTAAGMSSLAVIQRYADGQATEAEFVAVRDHAHASGGDVYWPEARDLFALTNLFLADGVRQLLDTIGGGTGRRNRWIGGRRAEVCDLIREIAGNPFRPWKVINPEWGGDLVQPDGELVRLTADARAVAVGIASDQGFDRLPVLADALEEGGLTDPELLGHLRRPGGHLRGCWALDVALGRC